MSPPDRIETEMSDREEELAHRSRAFRTLCQRRANRIAMNYEDLFSRLTDPNDCEQIQRQLDVVEERMQHLIDQSEFN